MAKTKWLSDPAHSEVQFKVKHLMITPEHKYITYLTFKAVEDYLPGEKFIKVHKSYIVAASRIDSIEGNEIRISGHYIPISRNLKDEVLEKLLKGKFLKR